MKKIAIYGAGGFGKEVRGMAEMQNIKVVGFIDDYKKELSIQDESLMDDVVIAIANPLHRFQIIENWSLKKFPFEPLLNGDVLLHPSVRMGKGAIICAGVKITVDVVIGDFVIVNLNSTIGHDTLIGSFSSLMPSVNISGNVTIGEQVFIGTGATILQGLTIGNDVTIGAGTLVTINIPTGATVVGVPGRIIKTKHG